MFITSHWINMWEFLGLPHRSSPNLGSLNITNHASEPLLGGRVTHETTHMSGKWARWICAPMGWELRRYSQESHQPWDDLHPSPRNHLSHVYGSLKIEQRKRNISFGSLTTFASQIPIMILKTSIVVSWIEAANSIRQSRIRSDNQNVSVRLEVPATYRAT